MTIYRIIYHMTTETRLIGQNANLLCTVHCRMEWQYMCHTFLNEIEASLKKTTNILCISCLCVLKSLNPALTFQIKLKIFYILVSYSLFQSKFSMESLTKPELLMLFSILEGELEARDLVIDALKVPRVVYITIMTRFPAWQLICLISVTLFRLRISSF